MIYKCEYCKTHTAHSEGQKLECINCGAAFEIKKELTQEQMLMRLMNQQRALSNASTSNYNALMAQHQSGISHALLNRALGLLF